MSLRLSFLALAGVLVLAAPAAAEDLTFEFSNLSGMAVVKLQVSPAHQADWGEDILGRDVLEPGETADVIIADGESTCVYDLRAVDEEGNEIEDHGIDLCELRSYTVE